LEPSVAQTIFSLVPAVVLIFASVIFREKLTKKALAGVFVAVAGVLILVWREQIKKLF
jgi:drug/metabolite transporter (DMT)-like permease